MWGVSLFGWLGAFLPVGENATRRGASLSDRRWQGESCACPVRECAFAKRAQSLLGTGKRLFVFLSFFLPSFLPSFLLLRHQIRAKWITDTHVVVVVVFVVICSSTLASAKRDTMHVAFRTYSALANQVGEYEGVFLPPSSSQQIYIK